MYARSTTIIGRPEAVDDCIAYVRDEIHPVTARLEGCLGLSLVVDRAFGRCIATSAWETPETMSLAEDELAPLRLRMAQVLGGEPEVDRWEIALMRRVRPASEGAWCRIIWARPQDIHIHVIRERFRNPILHEFETVEGFCSASLFVDRLERLLCTTATFESRAALDASRPEAAAARERAAMETGVEFIEIAEFELALAHLRVPELV
jgi:quinol monooxygenase YgiN